jgi:hypothetical protein
MWGSSQSSQTPVQVTKLPQGNWIMALAGMPDGAQSAAIKVAIAQTLIRIFCVGEEF